MCAYEKPKLAMYWAASCGGCEISVLNIAEKILDVDAFFDIVFWPLTTDYKYADVRAFPDGYIDLCLFNGAIGTSENEELALLLRQKSKHLVAFGSCAASGGIPGLANLTHTNEMLNTVFVDNPSTDNPEGILPEPLTQVPEGKLLLPTIFPEVKRLQEIVRVDYTIPGCPPEPPQIWSVMKMVASALQTNSALPLPGSHLGAANLAVCKECLLEKHDMKVSRFYRPYEIVPEPNLCLLEQGLVCLGPATRGGCGALCPKVGQGCRGCYGPLDGIEDQGAKILSAISSVLNSGTPMDEEQEIERNINAAVDTIADPAGTFYRFCVPESLLIRARTNGQAMKGGA